MILRLAAVDEGKDEGAKQATRLGPAIPVMPNTKLRSPFVRV